MNIINILVFGIVYSLARFLLKNCDTRGRLVTARPDVLLVRSYLAKQGRSRFIEPEWSGNGIGSIWVDTIELLDTGLSAPVMIYG